MTKVLITTESPEEMKKLLAVAKKNKLHFSYVAIKRKNPVVSVGQIDPYEESQLDQGLADAMDQGRTGKFVNKDEVLKILNQCK